MVRRIAYLSVVAVAITYIVLPADAQDDRPPRRFGSLSERLDSFRRDLLGTKKEEEPQNLPPVTRKVTRRPKSATMTNPQQRAATPEGAAEPQMADPQLTEPAAEGSILARLPEVRAP